VKRELIQESYAEAWIKNKCIAVKNFAKGYHLSHNNVIDKAGNNAEH